MADTYSSLLRLILQEQGGNRNLWGTIFNSGVIDLLEEALTGISFVDVSDTNVDLSAQNGLTDTARPMFVVAEGNPLVARTITVPTLSKLYFFINDTAEDLLIKTALSSALTLEAGQTAVLFVDATNNRIRTIGRAGAIVGPSDWTTFNQTFNNESGGPTTIACRYATQGHLVFFEVPGFTVTTDGTLAFAQLMPAAVRPGTAIGSPAMVQFPTWIEGGAANVEWAFTVLASGSMSFSNIGVGSPTNPDTYTLPERVCFVWSTRAP